MQCPLKVRTSVAMLDAVACSAWGAVVPSMIQNLCWHVLDQCGQFDFVYVPVDLKHWARYSFAFVNFPNSDLRRIFFSMPGRACHDVSVVTCD